MSHLYAGTTNVVNVVHGLSTVDVRNAHTTPSSAGTPSFSPPITSDDKNIGELFVLLDQERERDGCSTLADVV